MMLSYKPINLSQAACRTTIPHLTPDLFVQGYGPVAEGDGVAEAGLPLHHPLGQGHDDLGALGVGVEQQGADDQTGAHVAPSTLDGQQALGFVVASVSRRGELAPQGVWREDGEQVR